MLPLIPPAFAIVFMAICAGIRWPLWETAFYSDYSPVSWLSSAQLVGGALLALREAAARSLPKALSLWLAAGLTFLALDEQFMFHEQWKYARHDWSAAGLGKWVLELPTIAVGVLGLCTLIWMHRAIPVRQVRQWAWTAVSIGIFALLVDQAPMPETIAAFEEGFEVLAEAFFLSALLAVPLPAAMPGQSRVT